MTHDELQATFKQAYSVKLLVSPNASLILSFLYAQFKQPGRVVIAHHELREALEDQLLALRTQDARRYPSDAQSYLRQWCDEDHRFLRKYFAVGQDDPVYELTSHTERAIEWMISLHKTDFIGTESRFLRILDLLKEIVINCTPDVAVRLQYLEAQRAMIDAQIDALNTAVEAAEDDEPDISLYSETQVKERLFEASDGARRLLADFREVEENFRAIARSVHEQQFRLGTRKGEILRYFLNAEDAIKESDQGRSFYAFWQFLMSQSQQDELREWLDTIEAMPAFEIDSEQPPVLRHLKRYLLEAGTQVVASNRRLIQQLRQVLDEQQAGQMQRVHDLITDIGKLALELSPDFPEDEAFIDLEGAPGVEMPLERQLWEPPVTSRFDHRPLAQGEANLAEADLQALSNQVYVNEQQLRRNIDTLLKRSQSVTLADVVKSYPIERGLTEVITYLSIAAKSRQHRIDTDVHDTIAVGQQAEVRDMTLPRIVFARASVSD
ncbi:MAG: hypothetical protein ETSY1_08330 [Candidatus Entotheonella factor]|uniref:DUF3375 domain-containing protein n=1 Tax=Entotheonella factor TaxID=1429438 RepID=W4LT18_ENTF1|nr:MAG: hypothetical protein ETSY1_08330 [Candidatus Entotheonella factor]